MVEKSQKYIIGMVNYNRKFFSKPNTDTLRDACHSISDYVQIF